MTENQRPAPRLASDIARTWLATGITTIVLFGMLAIFLPGIVASGSTAEIDSLDFARTYFYAGWTIFCIVTIAMTIATFARASADELRAWLDASAVPNKVWHRIWYWFSGGGAISWSISGSMVALVALLELAFSGRQLDPLTLVVAITVVPASIGIIITSFAVSHARLNRAASFVFSGDAPPRFVDYLYLSVQVTTTFGGSDVILRDSRARRAVSFHSLIAFGYNAFVLALLVSAILSAVSR